MRKPAHHLATILFAGAIALASATWFAVQVPTAEATCGTGSSVTIMDPSATTTQTINGVHTLRAYSTPTTASGLTFMVMTSAQTPIGEATLSGSEWRLDWDSRNLTNGTYQLIAIAHFGSVTTLDCASPAVTMNVQNLPTQNPTLAATITPNNWDAPVGTSRTFSVDALYTDQYGRQSHVGPGTTNPFKWATNIGSLSTLYGTTTVLNTGTAAGTGTLWSDVYYAGLAAHATAPIKVVLSTSGTSGGTTASPSPSPSPGPTTATSGSGSTTDDATRLAGMPTIFRPADPTNSNPVVALSTLSCLEKKVGVNRFSEISSGKSQPTAAERRSGTTCFTGPEPIPAVLAPVAPTHIEELAQSQELVSVGDIKNTTITNAQGKKITGLLVTGKGTPNSSIYIYIFSDPLVLRAETDSKGVWSYVLETPLKSGKHEVYAVAEKDAGTFVRTSAVPISIAAAAPGSQNGSLIIENKWSPTQIGFAGLAVLMVLASIIVLFTVRRRHKPVGAVAGLTGAVVQPASPSPAAPIPQPTQPTAPQPATPTAPPAPVTSPEAPTNGPQT